VRGETAAGPRRAGAAASPLRRRAVAFALLAVAVVACRDAPRACVVTAVAVGPGMPQARMEALGLDRDALRQAALGGFARTKGFRAAPDEPPSRDRRCRATVALLDVRARPASGGASQVEVLLALDADVADGPESLREVVRNAETVRPGEEPRESVRRALDGAAGRAAAGLALALAEWDKPDAEVMRDLESGDPKIRDLAVQALAERRNPAALPGLVARLKDPDPEVVERAVGALARLRDPRAVGALIELTRRREGPFVAQLVRIIGDIGGADAEAYLETLRVGHPDAEVRDAATRALADLRRRPGPERR
jgi:HEAT repeat protein